MKLAKMVAALAVCAALGGAGGCSSGGSNGAEDMAAAGDLAAGPDLASKGGLKECTDSWTKVCNNLQGCYPFTVKVLYGTVDRCIQLQAAACARLAIVPQNTYGAMQEAACAAAIPTSNVDCEAMLGVFVTNGALGALPAACRPAPGTEPDGAPCASAFQCKSLGCNVDNGACGVCQPLAAANAPCQTTLDCRPGLVCGGAGTCQPYGKLDDPCDPDHPCLTSVLGCAGGKCTLYADLGAACSPLGTNAPLCNAFKGLFCSSATNKCAAFAEVASGDACNSGFTSAAACTDGTACLVTNATTAAGTCKPRGQAGEPCSPVGLMKPICEIGLLCINGMCQLGDPLTCHA